MSEAEESDGENAGLDPLQPLEDEEKYEGMEADKVPKVPPGPDPDKTFDTCNGKQTETIFIDGEGNRTLFQGYCDAATGAGTKTSSGRCKWHGGAGGGAPKHNQHNLKHGKNVDPHHYAQSLPDSEAQFLENVEEAICKRLLDQKGEIDFLDRVLARRIGVHLHIAAKESDYIENVSGLTEIVNTEHGSHEKEAALLSDVRQRDKDIFNMITKLGILSDPESQKADAIDNWKEFMTEGEDDEDDVIDVS